MEKRKVWKLNLVLNYTVLALAVIVVGFNFYDYISIRQIDWFNTCLALVMMFCSIFGILNAKRESSKEE